MKYFLLLLFTLLNSTGSSQDLSKNDFDKKLLSTLNQKYNAKKLPQGFYDCAYSNYMENKYDGFFEGNNVAIQCLKKYLLKIKFSDGGNKIWEIAIPYYKKECKKNNKAYENKMNVNNYCNCLIKQYSNRNIKLKTLISPEFAKSNLYDEIAMQCFQESKKQN